MDNKQTSSFKDNMTKAAGKFAGSRFVRAIMQAGFSVIPFTIIGAIFFNFDSVAAGFSNSRIRGALR
ncbi:hypothetical protein AAX19_08100 [Oenococcus oeni]|nr:hypothetical protein AAX19_08100 [Oenococcus oeni]